MNRITARNNPEWKDIYKEEAERRESEATISDNHDFNTWYYHQKDKVALVVKNYPRKK